MTLKKDIALSVEETNSLEFMTMFRDYEELFLCFCFFFGELIVCFDNPLLFFIPDDIFAFFAINEDMDSSKKSDISPQVVLTSFLNDFSLHYFSFLLNVA